MKMTDLSQALSLLDQAAIEVDDIIFAELVCRAAEVADLLEKSSVDESVLIWSRIADLDGDRARIWELVDRARVRVQSAGIETLPTTAQEYQAYLESLPTAQRFLTQIRYLQRVVTSERGSPAAVKAAGEALELLAQYESTDSLTKKQKVMKLIFQDVLKRNNTADKFDYI